jgi:3-isopropylmalate/(R)-2-methylmalate dehydratase large subunit
MAKTLYDKLWENHVVHQEADGTALLYIDRHLVHEVTSPQAFEGLKLAGRKPWRVSSIVSTPDHNTPTDHWDEGIKDPISRQQVETLDANIREVGALAYFPFKDPRMGILHVVGPENGATLPGMTVVCGDSHTSTHGAFACMAHGIGTSEVEHVLGVATVKSWLAPAQAGAEKQAAAGPIAGSSFALHKVGRLTGADGRHAGRRRPPPPAPPARRQRRSAFSQYPALTP